MSKFKKVYNNINEAHNASLQGRMQTKVIKAVKAGGKKATKNAQKGAKTARKAGYKKR